MCGRPRTCVRNVARVICPKCQNTMRTVDRQGIHIDQCDSCRGIFLDRGELESILNAEQQYMGAAAPPPYQGGPAPAGPPPRAGGYYPDSPKGYGRGGYPDSPKGYGRGGYPDSPRGYHGGHGGHGHRRRKSFMEQLFD
ncbi:MAG: zf-TFIIB domain-containing protein [Actinophytocola sp.]|uniref:TFIIB-type zinc ribbon-containing protein n=1 Tax=Actinophytocola sp. TaxID=1872138 RepID=UPI003D6BCADC